MSDTTVIKCSDYCGFSVTGTPEYCQEIYEDHEHQAEPGTVLPVRWHESLFSVEGMVIAVVVVLGIVIVIPALFGMPL